MRITDDNKLNTLELSMPIEHRLLATPKLNETITNIQKDVFKTLVVCKLNGTTVLAHITPKAHALNEMDERTTQFFKKVMGVVAQKLVNNPAVQMAFLQLMLTIKDDLIAEKLVQVTGVPHVQKLISEFDAISPSIVDDINSFEAPKVVSKL